MSNVSRELALDYIHETPFGQEMLGIYESLAVTGQMQPRARLVGNAMHVVMVDELRTTQEIGTDVRSVAFSTNGEFTNVRVTSGETVSSSSISVLGFGPDVVFAFEVGAYSRDMRRLGGVDFDDASFNGVVFRPSGRLYSAGSPEVQLYQASLGRMERAFVKKLGSTNKIRFIN